MARPIHFSFSGKEHALALGRKITKDDLYGKVKRVVEKDGQPLERGLLAPDGALLSRREFSTARLDPDGTPCDPLELLHDGEPAQSLPSSFDEAAPLDTQPLTSLAGFCVSDVYPLDDCQLAVGLYSTWFAYRKGPERREAMVLVRKEDAFLLVGHRKSSPLVGLGVMYDFFDAGIDDDSDEEDSEDLDFAMM